MSSNDNDGNDLRLPKDANSDADEEKPIWNAAARQLTFRGKVVKWFQRQPAENQIAILEKFQEAGWPRSIANPFQFDGLGNAKKRLHDAVEGLNERQTLPLLRFRRDGNGGVSWWPREP